MVYVSSPPQQHLHISAQLAVVFHLARWKDEGVRGGGELPSSLLGLVQAHETAGVLQKPIIEVPAPRLAKQEEGESVIVSIHR